MDNMEHFEYPEEACAGLTAVLVSLWAFIFSCIVFGLVS